jgi:amino acid transporter
MQRGEELLAATAAASLRSGVGMAISYGQCKKNRPRAIWLIEFWCLMINAICGLIYLLVFIIVVHMMRRGLDLGN